MTFNKLNDKPNWSVNKM